MIISLLKPNKILLFSSSFIQHIPLYFVFTLADKHYIGYERGGSGGVDRLRDNNNNLLSAGGGTQ